MAARLVKRSAPQGGPVGWLSATGADGVTPMLGVLEDPASAAAVGGTVGWAAAKAGDVGVSTPSVGVGNVGVTVGEDAGPVCWLSGWVVEDPTAGWPEVGTGVTGEVTAGSVGLVAEGAGGAVGCVVAGGPDERSMPWARAISSIVKAGRPLSPAVHDQPSTSPSRTIRLEAPTGWSTQRPSGVSP